MKLRRVLHMAAAAAILIAAAGACGSSSGLPDKVKYAAPPQSMLMGGVSVQFQLAHAEDDELKVRMFFTNMSNQVMFVNRDGIGLRLPDGRVLQRRGSNHEPHRIEPTTGHEVFVNFEEKGLDMRTIQSASVIIGGISYGNDPMPRTVGEIPITWAGNADD